MNISEFKNQEYVGYFVESDRDIIPREVGKPLHWKRKLKFITNHPLAKEQLSICYMVVVDGEVKKIGQTSGKGGIKDCMDLYGGAGTDDPSISRFGVISLIREEIEKGSKVEIYFQYEEPKKMSFNGATGSVTTMVPISAKVIEEDCNDYHKKTTGLLPEWCFQENGQSWPVWVVEGLAADKSKRAEFTKLKEKGKV